MVSVLGLKVKENGRWGIGTGDWVVDVPTYIVHCASFFYF